MQHYFPYDGEYSLRAFLERNDLPKLEGVRFFQTRVQLKAPVREIRQTSSGVVVVADGVTVTAPRVVVAVPPALAARIRYAPLLPSQRALDPSTPDPTA